MKNNKFLSSFKVFLAIFFGSLVLFIWFNVIILYQPFVGVRPIGTITSNNVFSESEKLREYTKSLSEMDRTSPLWREGVVQFLIGTLEKTGIGECGLSTNWCYTIQEYSILGDIHKNIVVSENDNSAEWIFIIGAHYDSFHDLPGADDNASGVAWILELIRVVSKNPNSFSHKKLEFVLYSSEEPPYYATKNMWSYIHAESLYTRKVEWVIILEMIGYFSIDKWSQDFPLSILKYLYPEKWNFIALISKNDWGNIGLTRSLKKSMTSYISENKLIDVYSMNAPRFVQGIDFSDHRNYWTFDIPAVMITDTSFYRNRAYHTREDTYERLDYEKMKEVVDSVLFFFQDTEK